MTNEGLEKATLGWPFCCVWIYKEQHQLISSSMPEQKIIRMPGSARARTFV